MEYVLGPLLGLLLGMKFTDYSTKLRKKEIEAFEERVTLMEDKISSTIIKVDEVDKEILKKSLKIILPIAQATERLQEAVGVK